MAHEVHTTDALVLGNVDVQDADKLFWLLTKDFGLIFASAKSIREEVSKLRYSLQDLTHTQVSLVRGRGMWRITGADSQTHTHTLDMDGAVAFGRITALVRRVVPTDEPNGDAYDIIYSAFSALAEHTISTECIEVLTVARLLYRLGYVLRNEVVGELLDGHEFTPRMHEQCSSEVIEILVTAINTGLTESQL